MWIFCFVEVTHQHNLMLLRLKDLNDRTCLTVSHSEDHRYSVSPEEAPVFQWEKDKNQNNDLHGHLACVAGLR